MSSMSLTTSTRAALPLPPCSLPTKPRVSLWRSMSCPTVPQSVSPHLPPTRGLSTRPGQRCTTPRGRSSPRASRPPTQWGTGAASVCRGPAGERRETGRTGPRGGTSRGPPSYPSASLSAVPRPASSCRERERTLLLSPPPH